MRIGTRLWLFGAVLPVAGLVGSLVFSGWYFQVQLEKQLDQALLTQAAIESASLFDAPNWTPHLHISDSPLAAQVRRFGLRGTIFGPDGEVVVHYPPGPLPQTARAKPGPPGPPVIFTRHGKPEGHERVLQVSVAQPGGNRYLLEFSVPMEGIDDAVEAFRKLAAVIAFVLGATGIALQLWQGRRISRRVRALTDHMGALREGHLEATPPPDDGKDEIADLRAVVDDATRRLRDARLAQDRLIAEAAHELRTPLGVMRTGVDLALRRHRDTEELRRALEEVRDEVDRLASLSSRLLDLAAVGRGSWDRTPGDLAEVARDAVETARDAAEARGVLVHLDAHGPVKMSFHAGGMRQAIDNLVSNAVKYSPRGGEVLVTVERTGGAARITVQDHGPGIPAADREVVFEPFHRGSQGTKGTIGKSGAGLGLSIVRTIAQHHGGRAFVADSPAGARVVIEIPVEVGVSARRRGETAPA